MKPINIILEFLEGKRGEPISPYNSNILPPRYSRKDTYDTYTLSDPDGSEIIVFNDFHISTSGSQIFADDRVLQHGGFERPSISVNLENPDSLDKLWEFINRQ